MENLTMIMDARQVRNVLGIYDDDLLNAACDAMESEEMEERVWKVFERHMSNRIRIEDAIFETEPIFRELEKQFGFEWKSSNEEYQEWVLTNGTFDLFIYPVWYYERPGSTFAMYNYHVVHSDLFC